MDAYPSSSWLTLAAPFGLILYLALVLGFLWVVVRVVRHAWYWGAASPKVLRGDNADPAGPDA